MVRTFAVACVISCLTSIAWAQSTPVAGTPAPAAGSPAIKPAVKKPAQKAKTAAKQGPGESGPCQLGVIPAIGDEFVVQKVGLTIFGNEQTPVPIDGWGLDDLVVARIRAAVPGTSVRKIVYSRAAFASYDHPAPTLFRNAREELIATVRQIAGNANCERYVVVTKFTGKLDGTNQTLRGIGVLNYGSSLFNRTSLFANIEATMIDGQTFEIRKKPFDLGAVLAGTLARMTRDPLTELDNTAFPDPPTAASNSALLRDRTRGLVAAHLDKMLPGFLNEEQP